jgi:hypothetical protein
MEMWKLDRPDQVADAEGPVQIGARAKELILRGVGQVIEGPSMEKSSPSTTLFDVLAGASNAASDSPGSLWVRHFAYRHASPAS